jgi:hypothetical protein
MVDQIGEGVGKLHEIALAMKDELDVHDVVIGEVTEKADKAKSQLDTVNKKLKKTLDTVNSSGDKFCVNVICLVLLLGILTVSGVNAVNGVGCEYLTHTHTSGHLQYGNEKFQLS